MPTNENKKIGQKIRKARISANLTQGELGKIIKKTGSAVGYFEAGLRKISPDMLKKISEALNKPFRYFYDEAEEEYFVHSKVLLIEKQIKDLVKTIEKTEKERFENKDFFQNLAENLPKFVLFSSYEGFALFLNKKLREFLGTKSAPENMKSNKVFEKIEDILKANEQNIKNNTAFSADLKLKNQTSSFLVNPVYEKNGKYMGVWILEK